MSTRSKLIAEIDAFCRESGMTEWAFGTAVAKDGKFLRRIREGGGFTVDMLDRVRAYIVEQRAARLAGRATQPKRGKAA